MPKLQEVMISCKKSQSNNYITIHKPLVTYTNIETKKYWGLGNAHRRGKSEKTMQRSALLAASTGYNLPTMIINLYKAKPKTKQFKKQIQKRNINGEGRAPRRRQRKHTQC
jgi:hypothetical protein